MNRREDNTLKSLKARVKALEERMGAVKTTAAEKQELVAEALDLGHKAMKSFNARLSALEPPLGGGSRV